jgi:molybdopterin/thiamine biosynthesis adenylyltransferase
MTTYSLTLRDDHLEALAGHLLRDDGCEHAAYLLCNEVRIRHDPWNRQAHRTYLSSEVLPVSDDQIVESSPTLVTWRTACFAKALKRAQQRGQVVAIVHNHPEGATGFSEQDDRNEPDLLQMALNRNGEGTKILSVVLTADRQLAGRVWLHPSERGHEPLRAVRVTGRKCSLHFRDRGDGISPEAFHRQGLAFGRALNEDLRTLRIGVVGCGGTGSAVAMLLARLGIGHLLLVDNDIVDVTNLNRLHGAGQQDADAMRSKVATLAASITGLGLGVRVVTRESWVGDPECRDALRACDFIFGCTDDHDGRLFLNRLAYYYLVPVIDLGLAIEVGATEPPQLQSLDGRVTVLTPRAACLLCRDVVSQELAAGEAMRRDDPDEYEKHKAEAYVLGEGNPSPAVVTFTTELACMAVNELLQRLHGFRSETSDNRVRKFQLGLDRLPGHKPRPGCPICATDQLWGVGDVEPFLGRIG